MRISFQIALRTVGPVALVMAVAACGSYSFPAGSPRETGVVRGQVLAIPCAPVANPDNACAGRLMPGVLLTFTPASGAVVQTTTDTRGDYVTELPVGTWTVSLKGLRVIKGPSSVTILSGAPGVEADFVVDSGIRMPAPAA